MAKITKKGSTKTVRKQAGTQRGIGIKTAKELQDAVAAIKAQSTIKREEVVCVPKLAKTAGDSDASSIPYCHPDGYSSHTKDPTPDIVPASPTGLSTGTIEQDGPASSACTTSDDEGPLPSETSSGHEDLTEYHDQVLQDQQLEEAPKLSSTALEQNELTPTDADTVTNHHIAEYPTSVCYKSTWELSPEAQAHAEAEERFSGAWTFDFSSDMASCEAGLTQLLPVAPVKEDDAIIRASNCILDLLPVRTQVAAAKRADAILPLPDLVILEAQDFVEADERCTGLDLWTCDLLTAILGADMTELRPPRASDAADASDWVPVSPLVAQQVHSATAAEKDIAESGALVQELKGNGEQPEAHKPKEQPSAQQLITAPPAAPPCSWPVSLALHACSHLQAASAHRWLQARRFACIRLPLQLVPAAAVNATALTAAVCQYANSLAW